MFPRIFDATSSAINFCALLREHDRRNFEIFCYSHLQRGDDVTEKVRSLSDHWQNIVRLGDEEAEAVIRADRIDVLVDLALHTAHNRLPLFARKPAPVQVSYLGYCGTTGMEAIDYRLSDPHLDPAESDLACYREESVRLPHCYWCYQPGGLTPSPGPLPAARAGHITFGCLNNFAKVCAPALELWAKILRDVSGSRLLLHAPPGSSRRDLIARFASGDVSPERLEFVWRQPWEEYLKSLSRIDLALDPFPYGGGITTCDAIWMGVPVVSLSGRTAVGRGGRSILTNLGLPELIAESPRQYYDVAVSLSRDLARLEKLRSTLRERMEESPLRDAPAFARAVEGAYRRIWRRWCDGRANPNER